MIIFPSRDADEDSEKIIQGAAFINGIAVGSLLMGAVTGWRELLIVGTFGIFTAIGLFGIGIFLNIHGRIFGLRYGKSIYDKRRNMMPGMISQSFAGLLVIMAPVIAIALIIQ